MAINPETQYPGKIAPSDANYPYGSARNVTVPGDGTGTPWEAALVNDLFGFQQAMLALSSIVPSGSPDKVGASQYLEALLLVAGSTAATLTALKALEPLDGQLARMAGSATIGDGKGGVYRYDVASVAVDDGKRVITPDGGTGRWLLVNDLFLDTILRGDGVKGNPQTNVGVQIHRDITNAGSSSHGFNCADYFAEDGIAINPFGSDLQVGDGTQGGGFQLNHVNDFQTTDQVDLGLGGNVQHYSFISQNVLLSGTQTRVSHFVAIDQLGVRDTPGFGVPGFEANGAAVVNNQTGVVTTIRHGNNAKSIHATAGSTDGGSTLTSGGARSDFECPIFIRQADDSTSKTTGALVLTDGGIGCDGSIFAGAEVSANSATPSISVRSAAGTLLGSMSHDVTNFDIINDFAGVLRLGVSGANVVEVLSDRYRPVDDGVKFLGDASHRWNTVYATTGAINTSDENEKDILGSIDDKLLDAWGNVEHLLFRWKDAVEAKGDAARIHAGHIAQQVQKSLEDAGFDGFRYGLLCEDELTEEVTKNRKVSVIRKESVEVERETFEKSKDGKLVRTVVTEYEERPVMELLNVFNDDGTPYLVETTQQKKVTRKVEGKKVELFEPVTVMAPLVKSIPVMDEIDEEYTEMEKTGERRMGLRYDQCMIIEAAYLRREIARLKA